MIKQIIGSNTCTDVEVNDAFVNSLFSMIELLFGKKAHKSRHNLVNVEKWTMQEMNRIVIDQLQILIPHRINYIANFDV